MAYPHNDIAAAYLAATAEKLVQLREEETGNIERGAALLFDSHQKGGRFYVFGTGHSHMIAEEIYTRAGGYAPVRAILPPEFMLHEMPNKSTLLERLSGYAAVLLKLYRVQPGDVLLIISNSGRNTVPVEMAQLAKEMDCGVIAITSLAHSAAVAPRAELGKRLFELADVVLDNKSVPGDAGFSVEGLDTPMGPTSTITGAALAHALVLAFVQKLIQAGIQPPVFKSSNLDGADAYNETLFDTYC